MSEAWVLTLRVDGDTAYKTWLLIPRSVTQTRTLKLTHGLLVCCLVSEKRLVLLYAHYTDSAY